MPYRVIVCLIMVGKFSSFKTKLQRVCSRLLTLPCSCYSAFLAAYAATNEIPIFCEKFLKKVSTYIKSNHKRSALFREFSKCFQETDHKILKLYDVRWLCCYSYVEKLLKSWDSIKLFLNETVVSEKTKIAEYLLFIMCKVETKAYFLFLNIYFTFFKSI